MNLKDKLQDYYKACGHEVRGLAFNPKVIETRKRNEAGTDDVTIFWVEDESPDAPDSASEAKITGRLAELSDRYPTAKRFLLLGSMSGYSQPFKKLVRSLGVTITEEVLFFDAEFRSDTNRTAADIARQLVAAAEEAQSTRVQQPFASEVGDGQDRRTGGCLVTKLVNDLTRSGSQTKLTFVVGPAGAGKSVAFNETFRRCYEDFQRKKVRRMSGSRPLALTPQHLSRARGNTFSGVVETFLQTEITRPIGQEGMNWMVDQGLLCILCDGLDEILASDDQFFAYLLDRLTTPDSKGKIVVCVRDSLFNTCVELKDFLRDYGHGVEVVHLDKWNLETKRSYVSRRFSENPSLVEGFVNVVQSTPSLRALSDNAFYCRIISDAFERDQQVSARDASSVCEFALAQMLDREYEKGVILKAKINPEELREMLQAVAAEDFVGEFTGIPVEEVRGIADVVAPSSLSPEEKEDFLMRLVQLPIFARAETAGKVKFTHEILGYYLVASHLAAQLHRSHRDFCMSLDKESVLGRRALLDLLAEKIKAMGSASDLWQCLATINMPETAYRVVLQLAIIADPTGMPDAIKNVGLKHRSLNSLQFIGLDLAGAAFDQSDLTNAVFSECDLRKAKFEGSILYNTAFDVSRHDIEGLHLSDYSHVHSIRFGGRYVDQASKAVELLTGSKVPPKEGAETCPVTRQVVYLLGKFVRPNGQHRRDSVDLRGFLAGRRLDSGPSNEEIADVLCSHRYLSKRIRPKPGISRENEKLREIADLVTGRGMSPGLRVVIQELGAN
jgi:hypothetical protein